MRKIALLLLLAASPVLAQEKPDQRRTIAVTGKGEMRATPDRADVSFAVETTAEKASDAAAENAKRSAAVAAAVKPLAGVTGSVGTTHYAIEPRYETPRPGEAREPRITGYLARNEVRISGAPIDKVGALIDAAVAAGANRVGGLQFTFANDAELSRGALEKAGGDARAQAESVARGLGVRLKGVLSATTSQRPIPIEPRFQAMEMQAKAMPTPIEPGESSVSAVLQVVYEIE